MPFNIGITRKVSLTIYLSASGVRELQSLYRGSVPFLPALLKPKYTFFKYTKGLNLYEELWHLSIYRLCLSSFKLKDLSQDP